MLNVMSSGAMVMWRWRVAALGLCVLFAAAFPRSAVARGAVASEATVRAFPTPMTFVVALDH